MNDATAPGAPPDPGGAVQQRELLLRLPVSPYPGLRPFLDHEDMLMHGRREQIAEVVARLGRPRGGAVRETALAPPGGDPDAPAAPPTEALTRFVAVIGGSGSGKSSLIRAGVVPYLRQFGIPEVGDLWVPVVFTPGTNFRAPAPGESAETPITRLAWKFEHVLRGPASAARRAVMADLLRRPGGLGRLVDAYGPELDLPDGVDAAKACVLVVIDQFEELFHQSNRQLPDATQLIERVIDHFHQARAGSGSPRCFLALTMRSEHLNDCAGHIGLPEAINAGSYLVSRLDDAQVREVIEKPAQRYLRLRQRAARGDARLPRAVAFDPGVVQRLVDDTRRIAADPDHLPLLQHALARTWMQALAREGLPADGVPAAVQPVDLWHAAQAGGEGAEPATDANVLRSSLDSWAEHSFRSHDEAGQAQLAGMFARLAYKDGASGTYNQQRLYVASWPPGAAALHALLEPHWLRGVHYLFWDDEDPQRITVKVSHESFIRGWARLRALADHEAQRREQFGALLRATADWLAGGCQRGDLYDERALRRLADAQVDDALALEDRRADDDPPPAWHNWLLGATRGVAAVGYGDVRRFHQRSRQARDRNKRLALTGLLALPLAAVTAFSLMVQQPVTERAQLFFDAARSANGASLQIAYDRIGGGAGELAKLLQAARQLEQARRGEGIAFANTADRVLASPPLNQIALSRLLLLAADTVEPAVNGKLRAQLTRALWRTGATPPADRALQIDNEAERPEHNLACGQLRGTLVPAEGNRSDRYPRRGLFVVKARAEADGERPTDSRNDLLYTAELWRPGQCRLGSQVMAVPGDREPAMLFDASLSHLLLVVDSDPPGAPATLTLQRVFWDEPQPQFVAGAAPGEPSGTVQAIAEVQQPLAVVFNAQTAQSVRDQVRVNAGMAQATWRTPGGRAVRVGDEGWRIVMSTANRIAPDPPADAVRPLASAADDPACAAILSAVQREIAEGSRGPAAAPSPGYAPPVYLPAVYRDGGHCMVIIRGAPPNAPPDALRDQVDMRVFRRPLDDEVDAVRAGRVQPVSVSSFEFGRVRKTDQRWYVGAPGSAYDGWVMLQRRGAQSGATPWYVGAPWSTGALLRLGDEVLANHRRQTEPGGPPPPARPGG